MSKQIAKNTFTGGLQMDLHPLSSQNTVLTNALNATLVTIDGDEMILQNDMGNLKATYTQKNGEDGTEEEVEVTLTPDFIPIGINTLNGIAYIVSFNPNKQEGEIGTFPSPQYNLDGDLLIDDSNENDTLINKYQPLYNLYKGPVDNRKLTPKQENVERLLWAMRTTHFNFDLEHPVNIELQPSYDGSINIIINDGKNIPRLINSRFSAREDGTWEIPDRRRNINNIYKVYDGEVDSDQPSYSEPMCNCITNEEEDTEDIGDKVEDIECGCYSKVSCKQEIENQKLFDITTSLSKRVTSFPITVYNGVLNTGNLPVGNYTIYFKYCDEDGNETDFIAESGVISIFKGNDKDPFSIDGGERDMDSNKSINITLKYIDQGYSFIKVYYSRTSAAADENRIASAFEIIKTYPVDNGECNIIINGDEEKNQIPLTDLSQQLTIVNSAETELQIANRLFLGNVESQELYYKQLSNLSLYVVPYVKRELSKNRIGHINASNYSDDSNIGDDSIINFKFTHEYYNTKNIYYNVGYWNEEYYRLGIVYIFEDGSLSPVYNILGYETLNNTSSTKCKGIIDESKENRCQDVNNLFNDNFEIKDIQYTEDGFIDYHQLKYLNFTNNDSEEQYFVKDTMNAKGVIRINDDEIKKYKEEDTEESSKEKEDIPGNYLYSIGVYINQKIVSQLRNKYCIKGFFIVRQKRIPTILAQGFTMPWDKEAKVPIIEYWGTRHDFSRGTTISNEEGSCSQGHVFNQIFPYNYCLSPENEGKLTPIKRRCDVVESFIHQHAADAFGQANPKNTNEVTTQDDDYWKNACYNRGCSIHHEYLQRLYEIFPLTIDDEMIARKGAIDKEEKNIQFKTIYIKIKAIGTWYKVEQDGRIVSSSAPSDYNENNQIYQEDEGVDMINSYVNSISNNRMIDMGEYYTWTEEEGEEIGSLNSFKLKITNIEISYNNNYEKPNSEWVSLNIKDDSDNYYEEYYGHDQYEEYHEPEEGEQEIPFNYIIEGKRNNQLKKEIKIPKIKYDDGEVGSSYEEFEPSNVTGCSDQWNAPITYVANSYMNGRLDIRHYQFHEEDEDENYARTSKDRFRGVTLATQKHFWNLYKNCNKQQLTAICPEFEVRQPFFNQLFTGAEYKCKYNIYQYGILHRKPSNERYYYQPESDKWEEQKELNPKVNEKDRQEYLKFAMANGVWLKEKNKPDYKIRPYKIVSITDSVPVVAIDNTIFKSVLGSDQEAYRFEFINEEHAPKSCLKHIKDGHKDRMLCNTRNNLDFNLIRGYYTPYLGMVCQEKSSRDKDSYWDNEKGRGYGRNFTIYDSSYENSFKTNADIRIQDSSPYYAISERITFDLLHDTNYAKDIHSIKRSNNNIEYDLYRGDCFLYTFTHRLNRNFNDPVAPTNDHIINPTTWRDHFKPDETDTDSTEGTSKLAKINRGDVNAVKLGSWITVKGRSSYNLSIRSLDERYTSEAAMMGRARGFYPLQQASADGGYKIPNSYLINDGFGSTVGEKIYFTLPEAPYYANVFEDRVVYSDINIQDAYKNGYRTFKTSTITDYTKQYGKIIKLVDWYGHIICVFEHAVGILPVNERVESGQGIGGPVFVNSNKILPDVPSMISDKFGSCWKDSIIKTPYAIYGVDTSTKKIWKITGSTTLPTLSVISDFKIENFLKEHLDVDDTEQQVQIALRNVKSHYNQTKSDVIFTFYMTNTNRLESQQNKEKYDEEAWSLCLNEITSDQNSGSSGNFVTFYSWIPLESFNLNNKFYSFDRNLVRGILSFYDIDIIPDDELIEYVGKPVYDQNGILVDESTIDYCNPEETYYRRTYKYPKECMTALNIWEHNNPFIRPLPTHWYGHQHPFEFEFMVIEDPSVQKIWEDLKIVSNNAKPESFHFAITGDNYEFTEDIPNIFYRQEATKELYSNLGSPISYNKDYVKVHPNQQVKSTIFPLYYNRIDVYDNIYDLYQQMTGDYRDYQNLSGTEIYRNPRSRKYEMVTHIKNTPIDGEWVRITKQNAEELLKEQYKSDKDFDTQLDELYNLYYDAFNTAQRDCNLKLKKVKNPEQAFECEDNNYWYYLWIPQSRLRGNSHYKEDKWNIQIPTITLMQKNEPKWENGIPPLVLNWIPKLKNYEITGETLPNTYSIGQVSTDKWTFRKETKLRDKYCKIKVRYSGEELAIISAVLTTFNISYA